MTRVCLTIFLTLLAATSMAQEDDPFGLKGKLLDADTKEAIPRVTILVLNKQAGTSSRDNGTFSLPVHIGDEIKFSSIGYEPITLLVTEALKASTDSTDLVLFMIPAVYELDSVVVFHIGEDFYLKRKKGKPIEVIGLPKPTDNPRDWTETQIITNTSGVGIYGLLNAFDKRIQQQKKLKRLQADLDFRKERDEKLHKIFNKDIVKQVTRIDDRVLEEFMDFCNFSEAEILACTEYDMTVKLLRRYHQFLRR